MISGKRVSPLEVALIAVGIFDRLALRLIGLRRRHWLDRTVHGEWGNEAKRVARLQRKYGRSWEEWA